MKGNHMKNINITSPKMLNEVLNEILNVIAESDNIKSEKYIVSLTEADIVTLNAFLTLTSAQYGNPTVIKTLKNKLSKMEKIVNH